MEGLEAHGVRFVVWSSDTDLPCNEGPAGDHLGPLRAYLRERYRMVKAIGNEQIWQRKEFAAR